MKNQNQNYKSSDVEKKWQEKWAQTKIYEPVLEEPKRPFYNLHMFPYPSAEGLHVGNVYAFTGADVYGRFQRMKGHSLFQPFGLDGFGIHSENYALKVGSHPMEQAQKSEKRFYAQVASLGSGYDWSRVLETYDIDYYRWTQWVFIELFKAGLAYRKEAEVNWCPSCKTVLADEQVIDGKCERCGSEVEKKMLAQWFFRITAYSESLLEGLDRIDWTEKVKIAQRNWIGRSEGARIQFSVLSSQLSDTGESVVGQSVSKTDKQKTDQPATENRKPKTDNRIIEVFTTRPDTLHGATFMVISPEHPLALEMSKENKEVQAYIEQSRKKSDKEKREEKEKSGVFSGSYAINPVNDKQIPIWIADYVLMGYGTGAIMAVPAHDERDHEFAKKYDLPIEQVIAPETGREKEREERRDGTCALLFDPVTQKYGVSDYPDGIYRFFGGGMDEGEDLEESLVREVSEESGLDSFSHVEHIQTYFAHYYNSRKKLNRSALASCYLMIVSDTKQKERKLGPHEVDMKLVWLSAEEILSNWEATNKDGSTDHWIDFLKRGVARASELEYDKKEHDGRFVNQAFSGKGMLINSDEWDGWKMPQDISNAIKWLEEKGIGKGEVQYHLRDWLISRQRYWGPPIPMIYCESCAAKGESWFTQNRHSGEEPERRLQNRFWASPDESGSRQWRGQNDDLMAGWFPEENLPVELPYIDDYKPLGTGKSPLGNHPEFYETTCPHCGNKATRETDVSDTFLDSAWYFLRYLATDLSSIPFPMSKEAAANVIPPIIGGIQQPISPIRVGDDKENQIKDVKADIDRSEKRLAWLPVTVYTGGAEHSVLHLLYTRFLYKVLIDLGYIDPAKGDEPFPKFFAHGLIIKDGAKMSKSKGNVVVPDAYIKKFGADTLRTYLMFLGPFSDGGDFRDTGIEGMYRFLKRVWVMGTGKNITGTPLSTTTHAVLHKTIKGVTEDLSSFRYNTAIAKIMTLYNEFSKEKELNKEAFRVFLQLLAPFAPHMTEELWEIHQFSVLSSQLSDIGQSVVSQSVSKTGEQKTDPLETENRKLKTDNWSIHTSPWPEYDESALVEDEVVVVIQINGKTRGDLKVSKDNIGDQSFIEEKAKEVESVKKHLEGKKIQKVIYVRGRIINFVAS